MMCVSVDLLINTEQLYIIYFIHNDQHDQNNCSTRTDPQLLSPSSRQNTKQYFHSQNEAPFNNKNTSLTSQRTRNIAEHIQS